MKYYRVFVWWGEHNREGAAVEISKKEADNLLEEVNKRYKVEKVKMSNGQIWYRVDGKNIMVEGERTW